MLARIGVPRRVITAFAVIALSMVSLSALTTGAFFTDSKNVTGNSFTAGSVTLSTTPTSAAVAMSGMAPGDAKAGTVAVRNAGSLALRYSMLSTAENNDGQSLNSALEMTVKTDVTSCTVAAFASSGTVQYGPAVFGSVAGTKILGDPAQGPQAGDRTLAAGETEVLCVHVKLPLGVTSAHQNATTTGVFKFDAEQVANNSGAAAGLNAPTGLSTTAGATNRVTVRWTATTSPEATGYTVHRSTSSGGPYTQIRVVTSRTTVSYLDTIPGAGTYFYVVRATGPGGLMSDFSAETMFSNASGFRDCGAQAPLPGGDGNGFELNAVAACDGDPLTFAVDANSGKSNFPNWCQGDLSDSHMFYDFDVTAGMKPTSVIDGIDIRYTSSLSKVTSPEDGGDSGLCARLSNDGGVTWGDSYYKMPAYDTSVGQGGFGGPTAKWDLAWTPESFKNGNFRVRLIMDTEILDSTFSLYSLQANVHYH